MVGPTRRALPPSHWLKRGLRPGPGFPLSCWHPTWQGFDTWGGRRHLGFLVFLEEVSHADAHVLKLRTKQGSQPGLLDGGEAVLTAAPAPRVLCRMSSVS